MAQIGVGGNVRMIGLSRRRPWWPRLVAGRANGYSRCSPWPRGCPAPFRTETRPMQATHEKQMSDVAVLPIQGDALVSTTVARFKKQMRELAARTSRVVVDLSSVQFIDS